MPYLVQSAYNSVGKEESRSCTATFTTPTRPGSLIVAIVAGAGTLPSDIDGPFTDSWWWPWTFGWKRIGSRGLRDIQAEVWYRENSDPVTSVRFRSDDADKSLQVRLLEFAGVRQFDALDRVNIESSESDSPHTGDTGQTNQDDELVLAVIVNQYASTAQYGWSGGLARLYENTSPQRYRGDSDSDWERSRMSVHQLITTNRGSWGLYGNLSTDRRWMGFIFTFRGGTSGPARMTSRNQPPAVTIGGGGDLTVFGPLVSQNQPAAIRIGGGGRIGPSNYQYRLGGWSGLLIGSGTQYHVEGTDGLMGWNIRTSDEDLPRGDGALRGIDLQAAREFIFRMNVGKGREEVERNMQTLFRALVPQREEDWELLFRFPTLPLMMMRVRPSNLNRVRDHTQLQFANQQFALRAADPRIYTAVPKRIEVPVTPAGVAEPQRVKVTNIGNSPAYPVITFTGPSSGPPVTRVQLTNETALVSFEATLSLLPGAVLVADMDARITGAPRSVVTLDGQAKYGAWQLPREPFRIDPDPTGFGGYNEIYLRTEPAGAPVRCHLEYRDTWAG